MFLPEAHVWKFFLKKSFTLTWVLFKLISASW